MAIKLKRETIGGTEVPLVVFSDLSALRKISKTVAFKAHQQTAS